MIQLDSRTLLAALFSTYSMAMLCLLFVWRFQKTYSGFGEWVGALAMISIAWVLMTARGLVPDFLSIVCANTLLFVGNTLQLQAGRVFLHRGRLGPLWWWAFPPTVIVFVLLTYVWPDLQRRILVGGQYVTVPLAALGLDLILHSTPSVSQASRFTGTFVLDPSGALHPGSLRGRLHAWSLP